MHLQVVYLIENVQKDIQLINNVLEAEIVLKENGNKQLQEVEVTIRIQDGHALTDEELESIRKLCMEVFGVAENELSIVME